MRVLEHRRHSGRDPANPHLNRAGIALARRIGATLGRFDRVVTSEKPRAVETAIELGCRVDAELPELGAMPDDAGSFYLEKLQSFADFGELSRRNETMAHYARDQARLWLSELRKVPAGGRLLLVSHGGVIEFGAVSALPTIAVEWGPVLGYLEGIRLFWDGDQWVRGEVLRVDS